MCAACAAKRLHTPEDWAHHPYAGHGFTGSVWTHPDLAHGTQAGAAAPQISGEVRGKAAPAQGGEA